MNSLARVAPITCNRCAAGARGLSLLGYGRYIVSIGLVLFAFSTAVAWSYYGDRAMTYLFGVRSVFAYRVVYVIGFFVAAVADTSLIWLVAAITIAFMTIPNLVTMLILHREMKQEISDYWVKFKQENP